MGRPDDDEPDAGGSARDPPPRPARQARPLDGAAVPDRRRAARRAAARRAVGDDPDRPARVLPAVLPDGDPAPPQEDRAVVVGAARRSARRRAGRRSAVPAPPGVPQPRQPPPAHPLDARPVGQRAVDRGAADRHRRARPAGGGDDDGAAARGRLPGAARRGAHVRRRARPVRHRGVLPEPDRGEGLPADRSRCAAGPCAPSAARCTSRSGSTTCGGAASPASCASCASTATAIRSSSSRGRRPRGAGSSWCAISRTRS